MFCMVKKMNKYVMEMLRGFLVRATHLHWHIDKECLTDGNTLVKKYTLLRKVYILKSCPYKPKSLLCYAQASQGAVN